MSFKLVLLALVLQAGLTGPNPVVLLEVRPQFQFEDARQPVDYRIIITPHRDNFWTCWGWRLEEGEGTDDYIKQYRSSCQQLNGIYAPRVFYFTYRNLSPGKYIAFAEVYRVPNRIAGTITIPFQIIPRQ